ncbi:hypothetical protein WAI453_013040 [Rhynchosporium graminicola]
MSRYEAMAGIHAVVVAVVRHVNLLVIGSVDGTTSRWKSGNEIDEQDPAINPGDEEDLLRIAETLRRTQPVMSCHGSGSSCQSIEIPRAPVYDLLPRLPCPCPCDDRQITAGLRPDLLSDIGFFDRDVSQNVLHRKMFCIGIPKQCLLAFILPVGIFSHERVSPLSAACQADEPSSQVERLAVPMQLYCVAAQFWIQQVRAGSSSTEDVGHAAGGTDVLEMIHREAADTRNLRSASIRDSLNYHRIVTAASIPEVWGKCKL